MAADPPVSLHFSESIIPACILIHFRTFQRIDRTDLNTKVTVIADIRLLLISLQCKLRQNHAEPHHTPIFRGNQQCIPSNCTQSCRLCGMLGGNNAPPSPCFFIHFRAIRPQGHRQDMELFHIRAELNCHFIHFVRQNIPHYRIGYPCFTGQSPGREPAGEDNYRLAGRQHIQRVIPLRRFTEPINTRYTAQICSQLI